MTRQVFNGISRELRKRAPLEGGGTGFTTVPDGREISDIAVDIDFQEIARELGRKAMANKNGISKGLHGAVVVRVLSRKRVP